MLWRNHFGFSICDFKIYVILQRLAAFNNYRLAQAVKKCERKYTLKCICLPLRITTYLDGCKRAICSLKAFCALISPFHRSDLKNRRGACQTPANPLSLTITIFLQYLPLSSWQSLHSRPRLWCERIIMALLCTEHNMKKNKAAHYVQRCWKQYSAAQWTGISQQRMTGRFVNCGSMLTTSYIKVIQTRKNCLII